MIGQPAEVVADCRPMGQVRATASCGRPGAQRVPMWETVTIRELDGLTLVVEPSVASGAPGGRQPPADPAAEWWCPPHADRLARTSAAPERVVDAPCIHRRARPRIGLREELGRPPADWLSGR